MNGKLKAFCSWSGGKESALSFYRAKRAGIHIACLLNMISEDGKYSRSHGVDSKLLRLQAEAIDVPIVQRTTTWETYEEEFKKALSDFKEKQIRAGVFGDIDLQEHRDWVERICNDSDLKAILPLWNEERERLFEEFVDLGFKAIIVTTQSELLGKEWLGRTIDKQLLNKLKETKDVDLCGEKGEYHTFVYDGPIFKKPIEFVIGNKTLIDKHWFLELLY